jgi:hypothetical protein
MRKLFAGGGAIAAGLLLVIGLVAVAGNGTASTAHAQETCPDDTNCLVITVQADPDDTDAEFDFDSNTDQADFSLGSGESQVIEVDNNNTYTVTQAAADGWTLSDISCDGDDVDGITAETDADSGTATVNFDLANDEFQTVTCTFMNEQEGTATPEDADETATPEDDETVTPTSTPASVTTPTRTPTPAVISGNINPPNTGSAGLKH